MGNQQRAEGVRIQQGNVGTHDNDITTEGGRKRVNRVLNRATGARDMVLIDDHCIRHECQRRVGNCVPFVPHDDDDMRRFQLAGGCENVPKDGNAGQTVQHLRTRGLHSSPLPCRKNNDSEVLIGHAFILPLSAQLPPTIDRGELRLALLG
jgi:hypothetical protein